MKLNLKAKQLQMKWRNVADKVKARKWKLNKIKTTYRKTNTRYSDLNEDNIDAKILKIEPLKMG